MMHQCKYCGLDSTKNICYQKCDKCFESGKQGERQTGRTCAVLKQMTRGDVFVVSEIHYADILKRSHPWLMSNIATPETLERVLRGRRWMGEIYFDHTVYERRPEAITPSRKLFRQYT